MNPKKTMVLMVVALSWALLTPFAYAQRGMGDSAGRDERLRPIWAGGKVSSATQAADDDARPQPGQGRGFRWRGGRGPGQGGGPGYGTGPGFGRGQGRGRGMGADPRFQRDREMFHFLLSNRDSIHRTVKKLDHGVETLTESDDPKVASVIQEHVESMYKRVEQGNPIHMRDPLFAAIFGNAAKIGMKVERTAKGVRVTETSTDPFVAKLIQAHAEVVNLFVANGPAEVWKNHPVPK